MKLIILILDERDAEMVSNTLGEQDYDVTHVASTGGFMRRGNCTFLIGVEDNRVDDALLLIRDRMSSAEKRGDQRALAFVLNVKQYEKL